MLPFRNVPIPAKKVAGSKFNIYLSIVGGEVFPERFPF
jgi:hypothetical protein